MKITHKMKVTVLRSMCLMKTKIKSLVMKINAVSVDLLKNTGIYKETHKL